MFVEIKDDFDPEKIDLSGQCFRVRSFDDGGYRFISGEHVVYVREAGEGLFDVSCSEKEWQDIWYPYFDLGRNYRELRSKAQGKNGFIDDAMAFSQGIRVLRQDPWEMLVTFIISQRKNIPAISKAVEAVCLSYGHPVETEYETIYSFPTPAELSRATEEELKNCSLGYRTSYVADAAYRVSEGLLDLESLYALDDENLLSELMTVRGVGIKVANCVALFAYSRMSCVPVDVWIARAIEEDCHGDSPFDLFGDDAGIIQQYVYFYERLRDQYKETK